MPLSMAGKNVWQNTIRKIYFWGVVVVEKGEHFLGFTD